MNHTAKFDLTRIAPAAARILIVKLSSMGDVIHVTPCVRALREAFPRAQIAFAVESRWAAVVRRNPHIDRIIEATSDTTLTASYLWNARRLLANAGPFDVALDLQGTRRSAAWVYLSRARMKAGRGRRRPGWDKVSLPNANAHAILVAADICRSLGIPVASLDPEIVVDPHDDESLDQRVGEAGLPRSGFIAANPFSRWASKDWPEAQAAEVCARLARETNRHVIVVCGPDDRDRAARLVGSSRDGRLVSLAGALTLGEALCLYRRASAMVSCDSGPMHAAAALGTPVVALFGPTFPERTGPWGETHVVLHASRPISHDAYRDATEARHMRALQADAIVEAVKGRLVNAQAER